MTEDEAKTKWCPFIQVTLDGIGSRFATNRGQMAMKDDAEINLKCIGSDCALWRETTKKIVSNPLAAVAIYKTEVTGGYCGMAKAPY